MTWVECAKRCNLPPLEDMTRWMEDQQEKQEEQEIIKQAEQSARKEQYAVC